MDLILFLLVLVLLGLGAYLLFKVNLLFNISLPKP